MNCLRKVYCRTYQTAFRIALPILPYKTPELLENVDDLTRLLKKQGINRVLMVTDKSIRNLGITERLEKSLYSAKIRCFVYDDTTANPTTDNVESAVKMYVKNKCSALIGFGGGSSIDCAKAVGARIAKPKKSLQKMKGILKVRKKLPLLADVPTTAGTGSETTLAAVITDSRTRHKYPINDFVLIPKYAVLDPKVTRSLPKSITATTGMDALTHAVKAYIGRSTTKETRAQAIEAVQLIFDNIFKVYENVNDMEARKNMLYASYLAGCAFTKSYVGYVHAVAHTLGGRYNVPHGLANAVLLPYVLEDYGSSAYKKLHELAVSVGISSFSKSDRVGAEKFITAIKKMNEKMNIPKKIKGIKAKDIPRLAKYADKEGNPLYPVPKLMDDKELRKFYYKVME